MIINKSDGTLTIMTEEHDSLKASATENLSDEELNVMDEVKLTVLTVSTIIRSFFYTLNLSLHQRFITYMYWRWTTRRRLSDLKSCPRALWPLIKKQKAMKIFPAQRTIHLVLPLSRQGSFILGPCLFSAVLLEITKGYCSDFGDFHVLLKCIYIIICSGSLWPQKLDLKILT